MEKFIYIADDDDNIRNLIKSFLEREGYICYGFPTGDDLLKKFITEPCDLIILDVMMPGHDGFFILSELRKISNVPIIMLTARDSDADYIEGLNLGSDDYFTKPFSPIKLVTKVRSVFKRQESLSGVSSEVENSNELSFEDITINKKTKSATIKDSDLPLTPNEFALLSYLIVNKDRAVPRAELLDKIWGYETEIETRVADDTVKRLRKKLGDSDAKITTVWGYGFRLVSKEESDQ
ncbi:MAG: response regulator transcription factor [Clostridiales bacterium]|nr:response regulator transcription factor [Clostridiales bacterium]MBR6484358.1 response regulator transcription factor [Clostridiales bacterium]